MTFLYLITFFVRHRYSPLIVNGGITHLCCFVTATLTIRLIERLCVGTGPYSNDMFLEASFWNQCEPHTVLASYQAKPINNELHKVDYLLNILRSKREVGY